MKAYRQEVCSAVKVAEESGAQSHLHDGRQAVGGARGRRHDVVHIRLVLGLQCGIDGGQHLSCKHCCSSASQLLYHHLVDAVDDIGHRGRILDRR